MHRLRPTAPPDEPRFAPRLRPHSILVAARGSCSQEIGRCGHPHGNQYEPQDEVRPVAEARVTEGTGEGRVSHPSGIRRKVRRRQPESENVQGDAEPHDQDDSLRSIEPGGVHQRNCDTFLSRATHAQTRRRDFRPTAVVASRRNTWNDLRSKIHRRVTPLMGRGLAHGV